MDDIDRIVELTDTNNIDLYAFRFCIQILEKESKEPRKHLTHLKIESPYLYSFNGSTTRRARLKDNYEDGIYRVFRKESKNVIVFLTDEKDYPDLFSVFDTENIETKGQVSFDENYFVGHAVIVGLTSMPFNADYLKNANGVFDVYPKDNLVVIKNDMLSMGFSPIQYQQKLEGM